MHLVCQLAVIWAVVWFDIAPTQTENTQANLSLCGSKPNCGVNRSLYKLLHPPRLPASPPCPTLPRPSPLLQVPCFCFSPTSSLTVHHFGGYRWRAGLNMMEWEGPRQPQNHSASLKREKTVVTEDRDCSEQRGRKGINLSGYTVLLFLLILLYLGCYAVVCRDSESYYSL